MPRQRFYFVVPIVLALMLLIGGSVTYGQDNPTPQTHIVRRGETLFRIALRYGVSVTALAQANGITDPSRIYAGQKLTVPGFDPSPAVVENPMVAGTPITHTVGYGETLASIATQYGMTAEQILKINDIPNPNVIYRGQKLTVWSTSPVEPQLNAPNQPQVNVREPIQGQPSNETAPSVVSAPTATPVPASQTYVVKRGEHLSQIARRYGLNWSVIAQANNIGNPDHIYAGQTLLIPTGNTPGQDSRGATNPTYSGGGFPPTPTILVGKQIVVDLSDQRVYAFDNGNLVREVVVSTGLAGTPTVVGDFKVYVKYAAQTMSGPGYYLPAVPYVMYFFSGYALHGTYWHNNFGRPMSHGCVNLPTPEAEWFYTNFVEVGTPIHVQY